MAKSVHTDVQDGALLVIKNNATKMTVCSAQPTTYTEGNATNMLANVTTASGDFTLAAGDVSGRKVTVAAKSGVVIANSGTATHIALLDVTNSKLLMVTTCTSASLTANGTNTVSIPAFKAELANPT
jgi:hypothetical protein